LASAFETAVLYALELSVAPETLLVGTLWFDTTALTRGCTSEHGYRVPQSDTDADVIFPPEITTVAVMLPWRLVPVPVYDPSL
jgi:hypothetical protein